GDPVPGSRGAVAGAPSSVKAGLPVRPSGASPAAIARVRRLAGAGAISPSRSDVRSARWGCMRRRPASGRSVALRAVSVRTQRVLAFVPFARRWLRLFPREGTEDLDNAAHLVQ